MGNVRGVMGVRWYRGGGGLWGGRTKKIDTGNGTLMDIFVAWGFVFFESL